MLRLRGRHHRPILHKGLVNIFLDDVGDEIVQSMEVVAGGFSEEKQLFETLFELLFHVD
jgi:hypothetical protein